MKLEYTYWKGESGFLLGYLNKRPNQWTQGKDLEELEKMLEDLEESYDPAEPNLICVPHHPEIDDELARHILESAGIQEDTR
jgi:predicted RNase H-like HicB family nuclease